MLFLLFHLGADRYALPAADVVEVLPLLAWKEVPGVPRGLAGLIDYRGTLVPAVDVSMLALGRSAARRVSTRVVMVHYRPTDGESRLLGLVAEGVSELLTRAPAEFEPSTVEAGRARYLGPITRDARGLVQRVEVAELLTAELRAALFPLPARS